MNGSDDTTAAAAGVLRKSPGITALAKALVEAMAELENPPLDSTNPHYKNRYCSLAAARNAIAPVFARHGLAVLQSLGTGERGPRVVTIILHSSGEWLESEPLELPAQKQDAQGYGSAATYARRYSLLAAAGVVGDDDDDAHRAAVTAAPRTHQQQQPPAKGAAAATGGTVLARVEAFERRHLVKRGLCRAGELASWMAHQMGGVKPERWDGQEAEKLCKRFRRDLLEKAPVTRADIEALDAEIYRTGLSWPRLMELLGLPGATKRAQLKLPHLDDAMKAMKELADVPEEEAAAATA